MPEGVRAPVTSVTLRVCVANRQERWREERGEGRNEKERETASGAEKEKSGGGGRGRLFYFILRGPVAN